MKISEETVGILRNFSTLEPSIVVYPGNVIRTKTGDDNIVCEYVSEDTFEQTLSIYDLPRFLNSTKILGSDLDLSFEDESVILSNESGQTIRYGLTPESMIISMDKSVKDFNTVLTFKLSKDDISRINDAASALNIEHLTIHNNSSGSIMARVHQLDGEGNGSNRTDDYFDFIIGEYNGTATFEFVFDVDTLPSYPGDYEVSVAEDLFSKFVHNTVKLSYWTAMRDETTYTGD